MTFGLWGGIAEIRSCLITNPLKYNEEVLKLIRTTKQDWRPAR